MKSESSADGLHQTFDGDPRARSRGLVVLVVAVIQLLVIAACSQPATVEEPPATTVQGAGDDEAGDDTDTTDDAASDPGASEQQFAAVYEQLEGLTGEARTERLIELANEEGSLSIYTSNSDMPDLVDLMAETYENLDIEVGIFQAGSNEVLQRLLEEHRAGFQGADLTEFHAPQLVPLSQEGVLAEWVSPLSEQIRPELQYGTWTVTRLTPSVVAWNTDLVPSGQEPTSYEDLLDPRFADSIALESRSSDWFLGLWQYFTDERDWSDEEAEEYFRALAETSSHLQPHNLVIELLIAGERSVAANTYPALLIRDQEAGAPLEFRPFVEPVIATPSGVGMISTALHPAAALLLKEFLLTEAQDMLAEQGRVPPKELEEGGMLEGVELVVVNVESLVGDEYEMWVDRWERILQGQPLP